MIQLFFNTKEGQNSKILEEEIHRCKMNYKFIGSSELGKRKVMPFNSSRRGFAKIKLLAWQSTHLHPGCVAWRDKSQKLNCWPGRAHIYIQDVQPGETNRKKQGSKGGLDTRNADNEQVVDVESVLFHTNQQRTQQKSWQEKEKLSKWFDNLDHVNSVLT